MKFTPLHWVSFVGAGLVLAGTAAHKFAEGWSGGAPFQVKLLEIAPGKWLEEKTAHAWAQMARAAQADGVNLVVESAFRTMEEQSRLYAEWKAGKRSAVVAKPGTSNHQDGTAVDVDTDVGTNAAFKWLEANAFRFGFERTVASEPWHWEKTS